MGIHFDTLVELLKRDIHENERDDDLGKVREFFRSLVDRFTLVELPMDSSGIRPKLRTDINEYIRFLQDYLCTSLDYDSFILTPFSRTAVEDLESAVFMDPIEESRYRVTTCKNNSRNYKNVLVQVADIDIKGVSIDDTFAVDVEPIYVSHWVGDRRYTQDNCEHIAKNGEDISQDITNSVIPYIEQVAYMMHPANFLVRKESAQSRSLNGKSKKARKTINRPHFICLSKEDLQNFWREQTIDDIRMIHLVEGFWRTLKDERYVNLRGQQVFVRQHIRGTGELYGKEGMHYQIYVKVAANKIVPYTKETARIALKK